MDDAAEAKKQIEHLKKMETLIGKINKQGTTLANEAKQVEESVEKESEG